MAARRELIVWYAILLHLIWGMELLIDSNAENATALHLLSEICPAPIAGVAFLFAAFMAILFIVQPRWCPVRHVLLVALQQLLLVASAVSVFQAMSRSAFGDGVVRPRAFIIVDQVHALLVAVFHTVALRTIDRPRAGLACETVHCPLVEDHLLTIPTETNTAGADE